jgi:hypothetical protein
MLSVAIENVAIPLLSREDEPSCVAASINFIVPVGVTPAPELTVAVNVTD